MLTQLNLETFFISLVILKKMVFSLRFHVTALSEKSKLIANWITSQHQFKSLLGSIEKIVLNFLMIIGCLLLYSLPLPSWRASIFEVVLHIIEHARTTLGGTLTQI